MVAFISKLSNLAFLYLRTPFSDYIFLVARKEVRIFIRDNNNGDWKESCESTVECKENTLSKTFPETI